MKKCSYVGTRHRLWKKVLLYHTTSTALEGHNESIIVTRALLLIILVRPNYFAIQLVHPAEVEKAKKLTKLLLNFLT